jgi:hypothetical protein
MMSFVNLVRWRSLLKVCLRTHLLAAIPISIRYLSFLIDFLRTTSELHNRFWAAFPFDSRFEIETELALPL